MTKLITELQQINNQYSPELIEFFKQIHQSSQQNIESIKQQIEDAERELEHRRNLGENL